MPFVNEDKLNYFFLIWVPLLFPFFISLAVISSMMMTGNGSHKHLVQKFREKAFILSQLSIMLCLGFSQMTFIRLRKFLLCFYFVCVYYEKVGFYQIFLCIGMVWVLFFILSICYITLLDLGVLKQSGIPELNLAWSLYIILFHCC